MAWSATRFGDFGANKEGITNNTVQPAFSYKQTQSSTRSSVCQLDKLSIGSSATIVGIVIAKESPKQIFTRKNSGTERFLLSFVVRDSPTCFVNCTCWGSELFIKDLSRMFCIGDVVKMNNVQVQSNPSDGSDEKFRVSTPLPFRLTLSENHSDLTLYDGLDLGGYTPLLHIPTKPSSDYYTLEDILANGQSLNGEHINLLTVVRKVGPAKDITTKTGKQTKRCELKLFDESCPSFPLVLWGEEQVNYSQSWLPLETVLFISDVRMNYDDYRSGMVATSDSKTVFTTNPDTTDARCLYQFGQTQNFSSEDDTSGRPREQEDPPLDQINDIVKMEQIISRQGVSSDYAILYGIITKFDLDTDNVNHFFRRKCTKCKQLVTVGTGYQCTNPDCTLGALSVFNATGEVTAADPNLEFSIPISITDHTGTLQTWLTGSVVETMIGWNINDLMRLEPEKRTDLKWNYLLERCKFYIKMVKNFKNPEKISVRVLSCSRADPVEMQSNFMPIKKQMESSNIYQFQ